MFSFLKLIRFQNLIIIVLSMYFMRWFLIIPAFHEVGLTSEINEFIFALLVMSVILIAAAGYIVNDYFDIRTDRINKPDKVIIGKFISRRKAILLHPFLSFVGLLAGGFVCWKVHNLWFVLIFVLTIFFLWTYALFFQRKYIVGNMLISILSAFTLYLPWLFEITALEKHVNTAFLDFNILHFKIIFYVVFAYLISMIREIIKDIEDLSGDIKSGYRTLPIVSGIKFSKYLVALLISLLLIFTIYFQLVCFILPILIYFILFVQTLLIYNLIKLFQSSETAEFRHLSQICKVIMLTGIFSIPIIYYFCK